MARRALAALLFALSIAIVLPAFAYAAPAPSGEGLIPCGVTDANTPDSMRSQVATECEGCHLIQLLQKIIMFLIGLSIPIAVAMFAYAGFLYFSSGGGGAENISNAKKIFKSALFGFLVAITAWLIINTLLVTLLDPGKGYTAGSWFRIECSKIERVRDGKLGDVINQNLGVAPTPSSQGTVEGGTPTYSQGGQIVSGTGDCSAAAFAAAGISASMANNFSCLSSKENGACDASVCGDNGFSCSTLQVNITANKVYCRGTVLNCPSAFDSAYTGSHHNVVTKDQALADQCRQALMDPVCTAETANNIYNQWGNYNAWSTHSMCGL